MEPTIAMNNYSKGGRAELSLFSNGVPILSLNDDEFGTHNSAFLSTLAINLKNKQKSLDLNAGGGPFLKIQDADGYAATVGATRLVDKGTGASTLRTAASMVLFDKDGNVIWSTP
jgi:hypothetical protein